jgi:hypothetical protein
MSSYTERVDLKAVLGLYLGWDSGHFFRDFFFVVFLDPFRQMWI